MTSYRAAAYAAHRGGSARHIMDNTMPTTSDLPQASGSTEESILPEIDRPTLSLKLANFTAVVIPFAGLVVAIVLLWHIAFSWLYLAILLGMYLATATGVAVGFHRLFTHRSFKTSKPVVAILAVLGSMAVEGPVLRWVATHRRHHQYSDQESDPHSPHGHGTGLWSTMRGIWHSHVGWLFEPEIEGLDRYIVDLRKDKLVCWMSKHFTLWVLLGLLIPT
ncbi:MAG: acyl-CoA desaturase, partial [Phycisphaerales bacterium]|nr:acyl-CoA desaturase [Phycisphaerales bacterium]